ncbi:MAG: hypothetical protein ACLQUY_08835 [Ktedonobacterales bacterium]
MRGVSYVLIVLGVVVAIVGLANHFVIHANPFAHTSTILVAVGAVVAVIGVVAMMMGGSSSAAA